MCVNVDAMEIGCVEGMDIVKERNGRETLKLNGGTCLCYLPCVHSVKQTADSTSLDSEARTCGSSCRIASIMLELVALRTTCRDSSDHENYETVHNNSVELSARRRRDSRYRLRKIGAG